MSVRGLWAVSGRVCLCSGVCEWLKKIDRALVGERARDGSGGGR